MSRRLSFGGKKFSLGFMHSAAGTKKFKSLKPGQQKSWAGWDSKQSRNKMRKQMRKK
jgi:hypothetical protein